MKQATACNCLRFGSQWPSTVTVHVTVQQAGTLLVYMVKPETKDGLLRTLLRDLLLPCGYLHLPTEESNKLIQQPVRSRPGTCLNPLADVDHFLEKEDEIMPVHWYSEPPN